MVGNVRNGQLPLCLPFIPSVMLHLQDDGVLDNKMSATAGELCMGVCQGTGFRVLFLHSKAPVGLSSQFFG